MKKGLKLVLSIIVLHIYVFNLSAFAHHHHSKDLISIDPLCDSKSLEECFSENIRNSEFVFEGTVISSEKLKNNEGRWIIKTVYDVDKVFKGNIKKGKIIKIIDCKVFINELEQSFQEANIPVPKDMQLGFSKKNENGIILANKLEGVYQIKNSKKNPILGGGIHNFFPEYDLKNDKSYPNDRKDHILYYNQFNKKVSFKVAKDVYSFVLKSIGTSTYEDFTKINFEKKT